MDERTVIRGASSPDDTAAADDHTVDGPGSGPPVEIDESSLPLVSEAHYQLGDEHARGGLGRVVRGRDRRLGRVVAIKELLRQTYETRARFVREARITARLQHPGVVPIYEAGLWPNGQPFYAMRLVAGRPLSEAIDGCTSVAERMALLSRVLVVAETMAYAHSQDVIHRDLKPSNILVGDYGETVVIDWGLAKDLTESDGGPAPAPSAGVDPGVTTLGQVMGTPWYMAPEQARGEATDKRADVYALGAILYHLLGGVPPHSGTTSRDKVLEALAGGMPAPPLASRTPGLPANLLAIVDKALAAGADGRYPSAAELAADLRRFLNGQLVSVHRYTVGALVRRWIARHRAPVAVGAAALAVLLVVGGVSIVNVVQARDAARAQATVNQAQAGEMRAQRNRLILTQAESALERDPTESIAWLKEYPLEGSEWNRVRSIASDAVSRGVARHVLRDRAPVQGVAMSADGSRIATASDELVSVWDTRTGQLVSRRAHEEAWFVAISDDGRTVASAGRLDNDIRLWSGDHPGPRRLTGHTGTFVKLELAMGGRTIVSASIDGTIRLWDVGGAPRGILRGHRSGIADAAMFADGTRVASVGDDGTVRVWDLATATGRVIGAATGQAKVIAVAPSGAFVAATLGNDVWLWSTNGGHGRKLGHADGVMLAFAGDDLVAAVSSDKAIHVWQIESGKEMILRGHEQDISALAASRRGWLASGDTSGSVRLWRPIVDETEYEGLVLSGHRLVVYSAAFSADGARLVTVSMDETARVWDMRTPEATVTRGSATDLFQLAYTPDGAAIVTTSRDGSVRRWDLARKTSADLGRHGDTAYAVAVASDGRTAATGDWSGSVFWWDVGRRTHERAGETGGDVWALAFSPRGDWLAVASDGGAYIARSGSQLQALGGHDGAVFGVAFSPDGTTLATVGADATARLWNMSAGGAPGAVLRGHDDALIRPAFTPDGRELLTGGRTDGAVHVWDLATGTHRRMPDDGRALRALAISPDGALAASGGRDRTVRLRDLSTSTSIVLGEHDGTISDVAFSPDRRVLASSSVDGVIRLWDLATRSCETLRGHAGWVHRIAFRPDGRELASVSQDGTLRRWPVPSPHTVPTEPTALRAWLGAATSMAAESE